jgi:hypothetical protein
MHLLQHRLAVEALNTVYPNGINTAHADVLAAMRKPKIQTMISSMKDPEVTFFG